MHEFYTIKKAALPIITSAGFEEEMEVNRPDAFGSIHTVFSKDGKKLRLIWDGKDGCGFAQVQRENEWVDLPAYVPESGSADFLAHIEKLCNELKSILRTGQGAV